MKTNPDRFARSCFRVRDFRRPATVLRAGLVLTVFLMVQARLPAAVEVIEQAVCLPWTEDPLEEQIIVATDSLVSNAVWTPCLEPIFKERGKLCLAVPITKSSQFLKSEQYFMRVPGRQFVDDFSETWGPFTNRNPYRTHWQALIVKLT